MPINKNEHHDDQTNECCGFHIAGVVVYARIHSLKRVERALAALPGAQVHATSADGKLVLTLEGARSSHVAEQLHAVQAIPDVVSTALVYQHHENIDSSNEDIADETDSSRVH